MNKRRIERLGEAAVGSRAIGVGAVTGVLGGMNAFMVSRAGLLPSPIDGAIALLLVLIAGVYTHLLVYTLKESVTAAIIGLGVGGVTLVTAWIAPLWLLQYPPGARDVLLPGLLQRAVTDAMSTLLIIYLCGYFATLTVGGYLDW